MLSAIFAMDTNGVIGKEGGLPWNLPDDFAFFKKTTLGHPIIMGRKTLESLGRPLPGRQNIVITRNSHYKPEGVTVCNSVDEVMELLAGGDAFVIGGAEIYKLFDDKTDKLIVTVVEAEVEGDTSYHNPSFAGWEIEKEQPFEADERNPLSRTIKTYKRASEKPQTQLQMRLNSLANLPKQCIPEGYELRVLSPDSAEDVKAYGDIVRSAFGGESGNYEKEVIGHSNYISDGTFLIYEKEQEGEGLKSAVATSTAIIDPSPECKDGYLHMVAAYATHAGKGLGFQVSLACLVKMQSAGKTGCWLKTDDFRLPAIASYLKLGFEPDIFEESHRVRWDCILKDILVPRKDQITK
ncbi:MAG: dihydrofolate reductase [Bacillota bacterium]